MEKWWILKRDRNNMWLVYNQQGQFFLFGVLSKSVFYINHHDNIKILHSKLYNILISGGKDQSQRGNAKPNNQNGGNNTGGKTDQQTKKKSNMIVQDT